MDYDFVALDDGIDFVPLAKKPEDDIDFVPIKRESQHLKQAAAGVLDIGAGLPALAGLIATPFKAGYHAIADDTGLKDSFVKGLDNPAMRLAGDMHEGINDLIGVEDPVGFEQLSRLAPMLIPTPASLSGLVTKGAGAASKALGVTSSAGQKAMEFGAQVALPMVQTTKGASLGMKAAQVGAQDAITIGADQGIRYATDMPTIASSYDFIDDTMIENPGKTALGVATVIAATIVGSNAVAQKAAAAKRLADEASHFGSVPNDALTMPKVGAIDPLAMLDGKVSDIYSITRGKVESVTGDADEATDVLGLFKGDPHVASGAFMVSGELPNSAIRIDPYDTHQATMAREIALSPADKKIYEEFDAAFAEKTNRAVATMEAVNPNPGVDGSMTSRFQSYRDAMVSKINVRAKKVESEIADMQRVIDEDGYTANQQLAQIKDAKWRLNNLENDLKFWNEYGTAPTVKGADGRVWQIAPDGDTPSVFSANTPLDQQIDFLKSIKADTIETGLVVGSRSVPYLNRGDDLATSLASARQLDNAIKAGRSNAAVMDIVKSRSRLANALLDFMVEQGNLDDATAGLWRRNSTMEGTLYHVMRQESIAPDLGAIGRMKYILGWNNPTADEATRPLLSRYYQKARGIVDRAKSSLDSAAVSAATEKNNFEKMRSGAVSRQALDAGKGVMRPLNPMEATKSYIAAVIESTMQNKARLRAVNAIGEKVTPKMIGDSNVDDSRIMARYATLDPQTGKVIDGSIDKEVEKAIMTRAKSDNMEGIKQQQMIQVVNNGKPELWYVPSKTMQHALSFHPGITIGLNKIGAITKSLYQRGTTRNIFFAPLQAAYSGMLQFINAPANGLFYHVGDMMKGINEVLITGLANETANHIDRIAAGSALFRDSRFLQSFKNSLRETVQKSLMMEIFSRAGSGARSSTTIDSMTRVAKIGDEWIGALEMKGDGAAYNTIKGIYRYMSILNRAIQDGPLVGLEMKAMQKTLKEGYYVNARPAEIDGVKVLYKSPPKKENGKIPPAQYDRETNTITIDIDRLKRAHKTGWKSDKEAYSNMPHRFDNEDDFAEFVLQHELAHARQVTMANAPEGVARELQANDMADQARSMSRAKAARKANVLGKDIGGDYLAYGDSESVRAIRAWVPFSGAAIQGLRALGGAMAKHPAKTLGMISTAVVIPAIAEMSMLYSLGSEEQKEAFWKQSDSTRVSNMMIPHPDGKTFVQIPIEPTMRVIRAITIEMLDGLTNASNQYRPYKVEIADGADVETGQFGHAVITGLQSAIGLPLPPIMQASLAASGLQGMMGVDPNAETFLGGIRPVAGQQITAMGKGETNLPNGILSKQFEGVITAFTGALGGIGLSAFNQFTLGRESDIDERVDRAGEEVGSRLAAYSRAGQLFGLDETVKYTRTSHIDKELRVMIRGLKSMQAIEQSALNGGQLAGGVQPAGNVMLAPDDPNQVMAAANAAMIAKNPRFVDAGMRISTAMKQLSVIKASDRAQPDNIGMLPWLVAGEPFTREMKYRAEQQLSNIINQERVMQLYLMKQHEEITGVKFADFAGRSPPIRLDSPFAQPSGVFEEDGSYTPTPEAPQN